MPLQQISLDQSIYKKKDTNINRQQPSQKSSANGSPRTGHLTAAGATEDSFTERQKALWADQDKKQKEEREASMQQAQEIGMRVRAGLEKEKQSAQQQQQSVQQQQAKSQKEIEANPEPAANEMWPFYLSLPEENKEEFMNQMSAPTSSGSTVSSGGKTVDVGGKHYNAIFQNWIDTKKVMFSSDGKVIVNEPEETFESGTFKEKKNGDLYNSQTGETISGDDIPNDFKAVYKDVLERGLKWIGEIMETSVMQEWSTDEMETFTTKKKKELKNWIAGQLVQEGMTDIDEIQKLSEMAVGAFDWKQYLTTGETNNDEDVVSGLRELFDENPEERDNVEEYRAKYGTEAVNKALGFNGLKGKQTPAKE